jgi:hypothetical protein
VAKPVRFLSAAVALCVAASADAAEDRWSLDFGQGVAEYAVGSFAEGGSHLALSCAEAGVQPGSVSVSLVRGGFTPVGPTRARFVTDQGAVTLLLDANGAARFRSLSAATEFRSLWQLLAKARTLRIDYGPGAPMRFPVAGAAELLGGTICPKQVAQ